MEYYVYVLLNPLKRGKYKFNDFVFKYEPFYVGKGKNDRCITTIKENRNKFKKNIINKIIENNQKPIVEIIRNQLNEIEAFELECNLIKLIGRKDLGLGTLTNFTNGGEGSSGIIQKKETIEKRISSLEKYRPYFKTQDFKNKMRMIYNMRAKTDEFKIYCKEISERYKGEHNPMFGKHTSTKQKDAVKKAHIDGKIKLTEEGRSKIIETSKKRKGKKNSVTRKDSKIYQLTSPNGENFIIFGAVLLQKFCKENKLQYHVIKNNIGLITKDLIVGNKINAKNTIGWKINNSN